MSHLEMENHRRKSAFMGRYVSFEEGMTLCGGFKRRNEFAGLRVIYTCDPILNIIRIFI